MTVCQLSDLFGFKHTHSLECFAPTEAATDEILYQSPPLLPQQDDEEEAGC